MGEAGRQTVAHRFDWPVIARLHKQLYGELLRTLRTTSQKLSPAPVQHPLRSDPFRTFPHLQRNLYSLILLFVPQLIT